MRDFLIRRFVPNYQEVSDPTVRMSYGNLSGKVGIVVNTLLCCIKLFLGLSSGAISIVADAVHNLADAGSSIVTLLGFKLAAKPPDAEHPYGHGRIEYIAGFCIAAAIFAIGLELFKTSAEKILEPEEMATNASTMVILISSIFLQLWLGKFNQHIGRTIDSAAIEAASTDNLNDCLATAVVILSLAVHYFLGCNIDGAAGIFVAIFILHSGWEALQDTLQPLLGQPPKPEMIEGIERIVREQPQVQGMHDLLIHDYGPGRIFASLHAEVPATLDILAAHEVTDELEKKLRKEFHIMATVHMDPVVVNDPKVDALRDMADNIVRDTCDGLTMHDFRVTKKANGDCKLIFDVDVPQDCKMTDKAIGDWIKAKICEKGEQYHPVIRLDRFYC